MSLVVVETEPESVVKPSRPNIIPAMNRVAEVVAHLGHTVLRWERTENLPTGDVHSVFWWGANVPEKHLRNAAQRGIRPVWMEYGWTFDRSTHLQIDKKGTCGAISWAEEPLKYTGGDELPLQQEGDILVCLRYEGALINGDPFVSPWFLNGRQFAEFLLSVCPLPLRFRPHYASYPRPTQKLRAALEGRASWDCSVDFRTAAKGARAVCVIDSTAAVQAMEIGLPVFCFGRQAYRHPGAVHCLSNDRETARQAFQALAEGHSGIDTGAVHALLTRIQTRQWDLSDLSGMAKRMRRELGL